MSRHGVFSVDELELDTLSGNSYGQHNSTTRFSDSDCNVGGQRSVRDIIEQYNRQSSDREPNVNRLRLHRSRAGADYSDTLSSLGSSQHQMLLPTTKSSYFGLNNYNSETQYNVEAKKTQSSITTCCKNCSSCLCCQNRSHSSFLSFEDVEALPPAPAAENPINGNENIFLKKSCANINISTTGGSEEKLLNTVVYNSADDGNTMRQHQQHYKQNQQQLVVANLNEPMRQNHNLAKHDTKDDTDFPPPETTSYQSKTTIAKTSSGIRIIIDILYEQEQQLHCMTNAADIIGSRIETDIPQSHILDEFQQQTLAAKSNEGNTSCNGNLTGFNCQRNNF